ncbi:MAG: ribose 5-phosphate isomerase B [Candidatus Peregrinibacteria bacterium]|nr:ribose 5-phosphate isomerase B [Candidatus Peregrinibacteria bacterium]
MLIYIGSDHAGYKLKGTIHHYLEDELKYDVTDLGSFNEDAIDYPDIAREVAEKVFENEGSLGVLICGSGTGMCIAANKHVGIRAAACTNAYLAEQARKHNDANILCLGGRVLEEEEAKAIVKAFVGSTFEGGRHEVRVNKIKAMEG